MSVSEKSRIDEEYFIDCEIIGKAIYCTGYDNWRCGFFENDNEKKICKYFKRRK